MHEKNRTKAFKEEIKSLNFVIKCTREFYAWETNKGKYVRDYRVDFDYHCIHLYHTNNINEAQLFSNKALSSFESYLTQYMENEIDMYMPIRVKRETVILDGDKCQ